mmetsp:Transcript_6897/g.9912  ORF Transcript_6897/g.9912 Transcript_6897/m.9912 type:complete len:500 (-) Transcript_6897:461-1960(-)|eukprot:CAMPEP_0184871042 /NCGR_PEP_ID=MMETSP0580-20130426/39661_1 /TAXON_ID=1118495 /ORGANISM="Dactyliosolen fragilissimus" /LENGTH=499 /DNA_ID=CAMNT_0027373485 /DNA_START=408 /DNA_END=1910 /DNA_ORIENTATION=+
MPLIGGGSTITYSTSSSSATNNQATVHLSCIKRVKTDVPVKAKKKKKAKIRYSQAYYTFKHKKQIGDDSHKYDDECEPLELRSGLSTTRSGSNVEVPNLYRENIGMSGIKKKILSSSKGKIMGLSLTKKEEKKRLERQARFSTNAINLPSEAKVSSELLASRTNSIALSKRKRGNDSGDGNDNINNDDNNTIQTLADVSTTDSGPSNFVGTCENLEKSYLRLTTFPKVEDVRPLHILRLAFEHVKKTYVESEDYEWANEQIKSIRQDITIQGIRNDFVLRVYEMHARLSLECGDLNEFNQCQSRLRSLMEVGYDDGDDIPNTPFSSSSQSSLSSQPFLHQCKDIADEFAAYRLLYSLVQNEWSDVTKELKNANNLLSEDQKRKTYRCEGVSSCRHAILVAKSVVHNDYHMFFVLYENAPHMSAYLMDFLVKRMRCCAYELIVASYRPMLSVEFFREALQFQDLEETRTFLKQCGASFVKKGESEPPFWIDCKQSRPIVT